ncbi:MAG TPA: BrnA antitoxin family protein [Bryobacteraceae bacterium]|nr:BrnA antitoxin family protein [Bryobacteraceae bacterium]
MKDSYNFSKGKRGRVVPEPALEPGKVKITIRLDEDLLDHFGAMADASGGKVGYQTLINSALRDYIEGKAPKMEDALRRIIREELAANVAISTALRMASSSASP